MSKYAIDKDDIMDYNEVRKAERKYKRKSTAIICAFIIPGIIVLIFAVALLYLSWNPPLKDGNALNPTIVPFAEFSPEATEQTILPTQEPTPLPTPEPVNRRGTAIPIPDDIRDFMWGNSYKENNNISLDDLSYLTIPHYNFNYEVAEGNLVVNAALAEEVLDIFAELFDIQYPIECMKLVDYFGADDFESIEANNTSAFNYRPSTAGGGLSKHALGRAIDINPQINPYVNSSGTGSHANASQYWSRDVSQWTSAVAKAAYIGPGTEIYNIFVNKYGWEWGGSWSSYRDYQHFQKAY